MITCSKRDEYFTQILTRRFCFAISRFTSLYPMSVQPMKQVCFKKLKCCLIKISNCFTKLLNKLLSTEHETIFFKLELEESNTIITGYLSGMPRSSPSAASCLMKAVELLATAWCSCDSWVSKVCSLLPSTCMIITNIRTLRSRHCWVQLWQLNAAVTARCSGDSLVQLRQYFC